MSLTDTSTTPPASAVAADAHWAAKMAKLRRRPLPERSIAVDTDPAALRALEEAASVVQDLHRGAEPTGPDRKKLAAAEAQVDQAQAAVADAKVVLTFRALPDDVYEELLAQHPPKQADKDAERTYDGDTFPAALMSACSVDGMPPEDALELLTKSSQGDSTVLFNLVVSLNQAIGFRLDRG